ncbi:MAG: VanZ family protein [Clostridia bacterium]|nr:VanZ family protein [Clostridia bacterium]
MKKKIVIAVSWIAVAVCMGIIFFLSAQDGTESSGTSSWLLELLKLPVSEAFLRNAAHFLEFTGLAVLIFNALYHTAGNKKPFISFIITSIYAATDEFHQLFVEGRACTLSDWLTDSLGAASGVIAISILFYIFSCIKGGKQIDRK